MPDRDDARKKEAEEALARVQRDSETVFGSSLQRAADHFGAKDAPPEDSAELWGRRIGRLLSLIGVIVLGYWLGQQLKLW